MANIVLDQASGKLRTPVPTDMVVGSVVDPLDSVTRTVAEALDLRQPKDATLTALADLVTAANKLIYATGAGAFATADLTAQGRTFLAASTVAAQRSAVGASGVLAFGSGSSTNDSASGSGSDYAHTPTLTIPTAYLTADRLFRLTVPFKVVGGSAPPTLITKVKIGSSVVFANAAVTPLASQTTYFALQFVLHVDTVGASGGISCRPIVTAASASSATAATTTAQPVTIDTTTDQTLSIATLWSAAGTGTNQVVVSSPFIEVLN